MPCDTGTRLKKPTEKALFAEQQLAWKLSSATSGNRTTSGKKNPPPVTTSASPLSPTPASTSVRHVPTGAPPVVTTPENGMPTWLLPLMTNAPTDNGAPAATVSVAPQDPSPARPVVDPNVVSKMVNLHREYLFPCFVHTSKILF